MGKIKVQKNVGGIEGLCVIEPKVFGDSRGYFVETYNKNDMLEEGLDLEFVQDNQSSSSKGVLRGLHFQKQYPQGKLVRVTRGRVFDVAVDLRKESKTYGKWFGVELSADNFNDEGGLAWNDPEIGVEWPELTGEYNGTASNEGYALADGTPLNLSEKDKLWLGIKDTFAF